MKHSSHRSNKFLIPFYGLVIPLCTLLAIFLFPFSAQAAESVPTGTAAAALTLTSDKSEVPVGSQATLTVVRPDAIPADSAITYTSSDNAIATVSDSGVVTAAAKGDVTITAATQGLTAQTTIKVTDAAAATSTDSAAALTTSGITTESLQASITYQSHIQLYGWQGDTHPGDISGTTGQSLQMEAIKIQTGQDASQLGVQYRSHVQNVGWQDWKADGDVSGTTGQGLEMEAIQVKLTGAMADQFDVYYRVHIRDYGWLDWAKNGETAGSTGLSYRMEAIQIQIVAKGGAAPGATTAPSMDSTAILSSTHVNYQSHVQDIGWQDWAADGATSGTTGQAKRVEAMVANLGSPYGKDVISYNAHVEGIGWQGWKTSNQTAGTTGQGLRIEALQFQLSGATAKVFDVYYRAYVQNIGWMGWAKNGDYAGTTGGSLRVEAYEVRLVQKGAAAPGSTDNAYQYIAPKPVAPTIANMDFICAVVAQEGGQSYEGALAVISCIMNRADIGWGGSDPTAVIVAPYQFSAYSSGAYLKYVGADMPEVRQAVTDCIVGGVRSHPYLSFRSYYWKAGCVNIGGNYYA